MAFGYFSVARDTWKLERMIDMADTTSETLVAFCDGSYKKLKPVSWKHSQWIHFTLEDGSVVMVNPANVNYIQRSADGPGPNETKGGM
jgi:hypothetical protein